MAMTANRINHVIEKEFNLPYWSRGMRAYLKDILERANSTGDFDIDEELFEEFSKPSTYFIPQQTRLKIKDDLLDIRDGILTGKNIAPIRRPTEDEHNTVKDWPLDLASPLDLSKSPIYPYMLWIVPIDWLYNLIGTNFISCSYNADKSKPITVTVIDKESAERKLRNASEKMKTNHLKPIDVIEVVAGKPLKLVEE
jgi:hypothetical protein